MSPLVSKRILVVEDDDSIAELIVNSLRKEGYHVERASSSEQALSILATFKPDLILTDNEMSGMTGIEMLHDLRRREDYVSVIFVSGNSDSQLIVDSIKSGADDYIRKPFRVAELLARVEASLRTHELHRDLLEANRKLQSLVEHDDLTGLFNMRRMFEKIDVELKRARRFSRTTSCVMLDIDNFKKVNDSADHLFGSFVIRELGRIISRSIREVDMAARYGGDEFLVVLPETDFAGTQTFCDRLLETVRKFEFNDSRNATFLSISVGFVSHTGRSKLDPKELVRMADHCLYKAKEQGRDRAVGEKHITL